MALGGEVRAKFVVDDSQWQTGLTRVEGGVTHTGQVVAQQMGGIQGAFQQTGAGVAASADQMGAAVEKLSLGDRLQAGVAIFNQIGAAVQGVATDLDRAAGKADDLGDRLRATFGEAADQKAALAREGLKLGFDPEQLGSALQALKKFGADTEENLSRLQNASRATNTDIVGLAASFGRFQEFGDAKSLKALSKDLGASGEELARFGAKVDANNQVLIDTPPRLEAARTAMQRFIDTNFAGAAQASADASTQLSGELELLKGEVGAAAFGLKEGLAPAGLAAVQALRGMPDSLKGAVGIGVQFVGMGAQVGGSALQMAANISLLTQNTVLMNSAMTLVTRGVGGLKAIMLGTLGPLALAVAAIGGLALAVHAYNEELEATAKAGAELAKADADRLNNAHDQLGLIGKSAAEVRALGKDSKDVTALIFGLREQGQVAADTGNAAGLAKIRQEIATAIKTRADLLEIEKTQKAAELEAGKAKPGNAASVAAKQEKIELRDLNKAIADADKKAEADRKEANDARLDGIRNQAAAGELSKAQQIAAYKEVLAAAHLTASEQRNIEQSIAQLRGQIRAEDLAEDKRANEKKKQESEKAVRERVQAEKAAETKAKQEAEKQAQQVKVDKGQLQQLAREKAEIEKTAIQEQLGKLEGDLGKQGVLQSITVLLERRQQLVIQEIQAQRDAILENTKNEQIRVAATENAEAKIRAAKADTTKQVKAEADKQVQILKDQVTQTVAAVQQLKSQVGGELSNIFSDPTEGLGIKLGGFSLGGITKPTGGTLTDAQRGMGKYKFEPVPVSPAGSSGPPASEADSMAAKITSALRDAPMNITIQVDAGGKSDSKTFSGTASELARQSNTFNPDHMLGKL